MLAVKKYKHFCISIGVASALVMSANAACSATYCVGGEIGLGGIYANYNGGDTAQVHNYGGYANIASRTIYANRIQAFAGIQLGGGISNSSVFLLQMYHCLLIFLSMVISYLRIQWIEVCSQLGRS